MAATSAPKRVGFGSDATTPDGLSAPIPISNGGGKIKKPRANPFGMTNGCILHMVQQGGVFHASGLAKPASTKVNEVFLNRLIRRAIQLALHSRRKTLKVEDLISAMRLDGLKLQGYTGMPVPHLEPPIPKSVASTNAGSKRRQDGDEPSACATDAETDA